MPPRPEQSRAITIDAKRLSDGDALKLARGLIENSGRVKVDAPMSNPVVLVYSNREQIREAVILAVGRRPAADVGRVEFLECATVAEVLMAVDEGAVDVVILDGEAQPVGGMGISRQLHSELDNVPPVILLVLRRDDRWLATWSKADTVLLYPLDPISAAEAVASVLRRDSSRDSSAESVALPAR